MNSKIKGNSIYTTIRYHKLYSIAWAIPKDIELAHPQFNHPCYIDILLGADIYYTLLSLRQICFAKILPVLQNTVFVWIIAGRMTIVINKYPNQVLVPNIDNTELHK